MKKREYVKTKAKKVGHKIETKAEEYIHRFEHRFDERALDKAAELLRDVEYPNESVDYVKQRILFARETQSK